MRRGSQGILRAFSEPGGLHRLWTEPAVRNSFGAYQACEREPQKPMVPVELSARDISLWASETRKRADRLGHDAEKRQ